MNQLDIRQRLLEMGYLDLISLKRMGSGESNTSYFVQTNKEKLIVRIARDDTSVASRLEAEHHFLRFAEAMHISFAPRSLYYDAASGIHVMSYVPGKDASVLDLNETQLARFITQLKVLDSISYQTYEKWCAGQSITPHKPLQQPVRFKVNITDRLNYVWAYQDDPFAAEVLRWAEPKVARLRDLSEQIPSKITFMHDDLRWNEGGGNLRVQGDQIVFIDWELTGFVEDGMPEIADVLGSIPAGERNMRIARDLYTDYVKGADNIDELNRSIEYGVLWGRLGNPLWAGWRYVQLKVDGRTSLLERYKTLTRQGMRDAEDYFHKPFDQWF